MDDKLIERIKADRMTDAMGGNDRRRARVIEYENRIFADAAIIKAADELADAVKRERQEYGVSVYLADALAAYRAAVAEGWG